MAKHWASQMNLDPLLLLTGLCCVGWWRKPTTPDDDKLVGRGFIYAIKAHKPYVDWLDWGVNVFSLRGLPLMAAYFGVSPWAWLTIAVAWASRLVGSDNGRLILWGAPALILAMPHDIPAWMVLAHAVTFRRLL